MAKYKYTQDVYLISSGEKTRIKSVIENYSTKKVAYLLDNGMSVSDSDISDIEPQEEKPKRKKNKSKSIDALKMPSVEYKDIEKGTTGVEKFAESIKIVRDSLLNEENKD